MSRQLGSLHRSNSHPANLQNSVPIIPLFAFPPPDFVINIPSSTSSDTNSDASVFFAQFHNLITQILKLPTNLQTPNPLLPFTPKPTPLLFRNPLSDPSTPVNHYHPFPLPLMHPKLPQRIVHPLQTVQLTIPQIFHKFPQN